MDKVLKEHAKKLIEDADAALLTAEQDLKRALEKCKAVEGGDDAAVNEANELAGLFRMAVVTAGAGAIAARRKAAALLRDAEQIAGL